MYSSPLRFISCSASCSTLRRADEGCASGGWSPLSFGSSCAACSARERIEATSAASFCRIGTVRPSSCASSAISRWAGAASGLPSRDASFSASITASCDLTVNLSGCIGASFQFSEPAFQRQHPLHPGEVQAFGGELLDAAQALDVALRVEPGVLRRALGLDQATRLV